MLKSPYQKETPTQVSPYEYCKIFRETYFEEHLWTPASAFYIKTFPGVFAPIFHFCTPWKFQSNFGFLTFSWGIEIKNWCEMGWTNILRTYYSKEFVKTHWFQRFTENFIKFTTAKNKKKKKFQSYMGSFREYQGISG